MQAYLGQDKLERANWAEHDAGLVITVQELAERALFWEKFTQNHPDFIYYDKAKNLHNYYLSLLVTGLSNTPAFSFEKPAKLETEFKAAYEWVIARNAGTETHRVIKEFYGILQENNFVRNARAEQYQRRYHQR
jgi:hypothetical protein